MTLVPLAAYFNDKGFLKVGARSKVVVKKAIKMVVKNSGQMAGGRMAFKSTRRRPAATAWVTPAWAPVLVGWWSNRGQTWAPGRMVVKQRSNVGARSNGGQIVVKYGRPAARCLDGKAGRRQQGQAAVVVK